MNDQAEKELPNWQRCLIAVVGFWLMYTIIYGVGVV